MDRFADLETFIAVVETGSFSAAAERLDTTKSGVSRRVSALETRLGVKLLHRTTRRLSLTDSGRALFERGGRILTDLNEAEQAVSDAECALRGRIRLAAPLSFGLLHLAPAITAFAELHPAVQVELDLNDREVSLVEEGFDLALRIGRLADSSLIARQLCPIARVAVASPDYLARHGTPQRPQDLLHHAGLRYTNMPRQRYWHFVSSDGCTSNPEVPDRLCANNGELLTQAAVAGLGVTLQPSFIVHRELAEGRLTRILTDYTVPGAAMHAVFPPGRHLSRRVRVFADFLAERFGGEPYWDAEATTGS
jgi:DNA-binding transcriptional LysR family regulator